MFSYLVPVKTIDKFITQQTTAFLCKKYLELILTQLWSFAIGGYISKRCQIKPSLSMKWRQEINFDTLILMFLV